jgi:hypothetical protein
VSGLIKGDLGRRFLIDLAQSGHLFVRERGQARHEGLLPVFSTTTRKETEMLLTRHCRLARDGSGLYCLNDFSGEADDIGKVTDLLRSTYDVLAKTEVRHG